jgi:hypothetical protein
MCTLVSHAPSGWCSKMRTVCGDFERVPMGRNHLVVVPALAAGIHVFLGARPQARHGWPRQARHGSEKWNAI